MDPRIQTRHERKRGCGFRKAGGTYLISEGEGRGCGRLPIALNVCPTCGSGIKQTRGWTWINGAKLAETEHCAVADRPECKSCPMHNDVSTMEKVGLLWIGEAFYKTAADFTLEAQQMGISRRISTVPRDFVVGETWVWLAHPKHVKNPEPPPVLDPALKDDEEAVAQHEEDLAAYRPMLPAVFRMFRPQRIEYVCTGKETTEEVDALVKRGLTPVLVKKIGETDSMFEEGT
jgi:hypothetical protein